MDSTALFVSSNNELSGVSAYSYNNNIVVNFTTDLPMQFKLQLYNSLGQMIYTDELSVSTNNSIELPAVLKKNQIYLLVVNSGNKSISFKLF